jgi:hypothetical protein
MSLMNWRSVAIRRNFRAAGVRWRPRGSRDGAGAGGVEEIAVFRDRLTSRTQVGGQEGPCGFGDLALVCTWAISGFAAAGVAVWFGFDIGAVLGVAG